MPKYVDHDQRREELLAALWRVVERDGAGALSIRTIAAEAKVSKTNVAYYFPSRLAILMAAADQVVSQVAMKSVEAFIADPNFDTAIDGLCVAVPATDLRRRQSEVWLMLLIEGAQSSEMGELLNAFNERLFEHYRAGFALMVDAGFIDSSIDLDVEAARIQALIDGLSLHTTADDRRMDAALVRRIITTHLRSMAPLNSPLRQG
jgi:AcrR family transcriptional regulator